MDRQFHTGNRARLYQAMAPASLLVLFSGREVRKTNDEYYPFFADRSFVYLTGLTCKEAVLLAEKDAAGTVRERVYVLPPDPMAERWTGRRMKPAEVEAQSGVSDVRRADAFPAEFHRLATSGSFARVYLDLYRVSPEDIDRPAHMLRSRVQTEYPFLAIESATPIIRRLRLIKQPCEIAAMRKAEQITCEGILAMMRASRPGMYEYQYKAEWDRALGQYGPQSNAFPPIISAGGNNFCIHYYSYTGQAQDGDMVLNDVGAHWDNLMTDVSRGWPCNGRFTERQKLLFNCALATSDYLFSVIRPGMPMADVDRLTHEYNAQLLVDADVLDRVENIGKYMWHNGAHHVGYDVHDAVETPQVIAPGMVFCVDVGIYHEEWGVGFRLEDNCLVTADGCENLSACTPRTVADIEDVMRH